MDYFLNNVRGKSPAVKKAILWGVSGGITLLIVFIWILGGHVEKVETQTASISFSPWKEIKNSSEKMYQSISSQFEKIRSVKIENK